MSKNVRAPFAVLLEIRLRAQPDDEDTTGVLFVPATMASHYPEVKFHTRKKTHCSTDLATTVGIDGPFAGYKVLEAVHETVMPKLMEFLGEHVPGFGEEPTKEEVQEYLTGKLSEQLELIEAKLNGKKISSKLEDGQSADVLQFSHKATEEDTET